MKDVTARELKQALKPKRGKYGAVKKSLDGHTFDSTAEAKHYAELKMLEKAGAITHLELQPRFELFGVGPGPRHDLVLVGWYIADFQYRDQAQGGVTVVEDVKSSATATPLYKLKKKLVEAHHGFKITEIR